MGIGIYRPNSAFGKGISSLERTGRLYPIVSAFRMNEKNLELMKCHEDFKSEEEQQETKKIRKPGKGMK